VHTPTMHRKGGLKLGCGGGRSALMNWHFDSRPLVGRSPQLPGSATRRVLRRLLYSRSRLCCSSKHRRHRYPLGKPGTCLAWWRYGARTPPVSRIVKRKQQTRQSHRFRQRTDIMYETKYLNIFVHIYIMPTTMGDFGDEDARTLLLPAGYPAAAAADDASCG